MKTTPTQFILVDDDAINNMMCKFSISKHFGKAKINSFQSPEAALAMIGSTYRDNNPRPTVLFLDISMPTLSGWDFLDRFATFGKEVHEEFLIYIVSSSTSSMDHDLAWGHPFVKGFVSKPFTERKMEQLLRELPEDFGIRCFA